MTGKAVTMVPSILDAAPGFCLVQCSAEQNADRTGLSLSVSGELRHYQSSVRQSGLHRYQCCMSVANWPLCAKDRQRCVPPRVARTYPIKNDVACPCWNATCVTATSTRPLRRSDRRQRRPHRHVLGYVSGDAGLRAVS
jgi:hypothetical protein